MKQKITNTLTILGREFTFKNIAVTVYDKAMYVTMGGVSQVVRQYVKQRWGITVQIHTETFSMGDSVNVYLPVVDEKLADEINAELKYLFVYGTFNGMYDIYEQREDTLEVVLTHNGKSDTVSTKYLFVNNYPKYGTKLWLKHEEQARAREFANQELETI